LSDEKIPILLYTEPIGVNICGHRYNLASLGMEAAILGIRARLIKSVTVYIGGLILQRKISFVVELENPTDCAITISDIDLEVNTLTGTNRICKVKETFPTASDHGAFIVPARGVRRSPKFTAELCLAYMAALKLLGTPIIQAEIVSATVLLDKFKLPDLKFTLPRVRFRWRISLSK